MKMTKDLIARLEAARGPDRELDAEIAKHLGWVRAKSAEIGWYDESGMCCDVCPHYTRSIGAARSICEDAMLVYASEIGADGLPLVKLVTNTESPIVEHEGIAATLELAWCIAALKAREE